MDVAANLETVLQRLIGKACHLSFFGIPLGLPIGSEEGFYRVLTESIYRLQQINRSKEGLLLDYNDSSLVFTAQIQGISEFFEPDTLVYNHLRLAIEVYAQDIEVNWLVAPEDMQAKKGMSNWKLTSSKESDGYSTIFSKEYLDWEKTTHENTFTTQAPALRVYLLESWKGNP